MLELLSAYSVEQIIVFIVLLCVAGEKTIKTIDFYKGKGKEVLKKEESYNECIALVAELKEGMKNIQDKLDLLTQSDMDDIRGWMVEKYNYYKEDPTRKIDEFTMDTVERRYKHYKDEGGNSYITSIVDKLREMYKED